MLQVLLCWIWVSTCYWFWWMIALDSDWKGSICILWNVMRCRFSTFWTPHCLKGHCLIWLALLNALLLTSNWPICKELQLNVSVCFSGTEKCTLSIDLSPFSSLKMLWNFRGFKKIYTLSRFTQFKQTHSTMFKELAWMLDICMQSMTEGLIGKRSLWSFPLVEGVHNRQAHQGYNLLKHRNVPGSSGKAFLFPSPSLILVSICSMKSRVTMQFTIT